ncbi:hypothetical protein AB1A81_00975 [Bdellovibrio bacteriovorus]|nr:hypothetical protein [Bdellovibrio bacteriovorus]AHZ85849.1 hypothetical protein EP01_13010 [Bdellovibrio bacteriovorus]BEV66769.1 hypothetical protein Bb109J_c0189 [Bdellovibrio bacteriovorus]
MRIHLQLALSVLALSVAACSNGGGGGGGAAPVPATTTTTTPTPVDVQGEFTYEYKFNGCTTGRQKLTSKNAYCDALLNDALNNNCAREMRVETYNRMCTTNTQVSSPGTLPAMSTARCVVNGMDLKDRTFLQNMNPFNPQRRQIYRDMFWSGKNDQGYDILGSLVDSYGKGRLLLTPAQAGRSALGEIQLHQQRGDSKFSVRSGLGSQISLKVTNLEIQKEVEAVCLSDKSFKRTKADLRRVKCSLTHSESGRKETRRDEEIVWDVANKVEREIFRGRSTERITLRLKPAAGGQDERIAVEAVDLDIDKTMVAETTLNEGLEVRFRGQLTGTDLTIQCAPASK